LLEIWRGTRAYNEELTIGHGSEKSILTLGKKPYDLNIHYGVKG
jgi:hypothetical protein